MAKFIYVFSINERDSLLERGLTLLKSNDAANVFIFLNDERMDFANENITYVISDTLTF